MAKEKKEKKSKEDKKKEKEEKKKEKKEKKGKKGKDEEEEPGKGKKAKKDKKGKKDKKDKKDKKEKPKKEKKKKKGKKGESEEPETLEEEGGKKKKKGKKDKKDKKGKKGSKKGKQREDEDEVEAEEQPKKKKVKKSPSAAAETKAENPEGGEAAEAIEEPHYPWFNLSWASLHLLGMLFMLCDSLWSTMFPAVDQISLLGRMAYPIFAFLLVEGFFHTQNLWQYLLRLVGLAVVSEIPFNLFYGGSIIYPLHQNVIWTFIIALLFLILLEEFKEQFGFLPMLIFSPIPAFLGYFLAQVLFTDYYGAGVLIILVFYLFHGKHWWNFLGQLVCLWFINLKMLGGYYYVLPFLGYDFEFIQQAAAIFSLLLIWLYYERQGLHGKVFRWFCYSFYPVHLLVLCIIRIKFFG